MTKVEGNAMLLLNTKLNVPPVRPSHVQRVELIQKLDKLREYKLALIVASAGYGKTALVSEWIAQSRPKVAWFSIDSGDNDPVRFWDYVIAAIQTVYPDIGEQTLTLLHEPQPLPIETILSTLINELSALPELLTVVLDDYHVIDSPSIHEGLAFLVEHMPSQMRLIMTTRTDPPLPMARMRVRSQVLELRSADLRFSPPQIAAFFTDVMGLALNAEEVTALDTRVEGWIAGLQLAGLALQGKRDTAEFIASFAGDHRYVLDYLGDEILDRQPDAMQQFLLQTSILERLNANLCDTVTGLGGSYSVLEHLERNHFFVVALDDKRQWYRYHRLFADFLHHRLKLKYPDHLKELHQRASLWFERNGYQAEAIGHALAAQDNERAAELVQGIAELLIWRRAEHNTLLGWLTALPDRVMQMYPRLYLYQAWVLHLTNQMGAAEQCIRNAESVLNHAVGSPDPLINGMLAAVHSTLTGLHQQFPETLTLSRKALELLPEEAVSWRCMAAINLGVTCAYMGEVHEAVEVLSYAMELSQEIGSAFAMLSAFWHLSSLQAVQLTLRAAENTCQQLQHAADMPGLQRFPTSGYVALLLGEISIERNDPDAAERYLLESAEQINPESFPLALLRTYIALSHLKTLQVDMEGAEYYWQLAEQLERMSKLQGRATLLSISRARRWLEQGNLEAVERWTAENQLGLDDEFSYHREAHYLTLARFYIARGNVTDKALYLLERMVKRAEDGQRNGSLIRALILQALAFHAADDSQKAVESLARALLLAEPEQPLRVFADEGHPIALLLEKVLDMQRKGQLALPISSEYAARLLTTMGKNAPSPTPKRRTEGHLADALSPRELEVLRLLADGLESSEIAERLTIAVDTARTHIKNIYSKLDVHSRWEAIKHAEAYHLL
ncbi:MAG: LuxR C-terminal-related transcriptional regulator [Anaerolineae bacterium]|nr:LuxR C-terminal-related transcriptional regulator [Anaerolineae bacterium]